MVIITDRYSRITQELSRNDALAIAYRYKLQPTNVATREKIIAEISAKNENILQATYRFYFIVDDSSNLFNVDRDKILDYQFFPDRKGLEDAVDFGEVNKFLSKNKTRLNPTLQPGFSQPENKESPEPEKTIKLSDTLDERFTKFSKIETDTKNFGHSNFIGVKLKYEPSRGIDSFLSLVDNFADANAINEPSVKIKLALLALENSDYGLTVRQVLSTDDYRNWQSFAKKLKELLGKDADTFQDEYDNWSNSSETPALGIAQLIHLYKSSFDPPKESLDKDDEQRVIRKYIKSLDQPIRGLLLAELPKLSLHNLGNRCMELKRAFELKRDPFYPDKLSMISEPIEDSPTSSTKNDFCSKLDNLGESLVNLKNAYDDLNENYKDLCSAVYS